MRLQLYPNTESTVTFICIPYWIERSLKSKGIALSKVLNFKIMQETFPVETLAQLAAVQGIMEKATDLVNGRQLLTEWRKGATQAQMTELDFVIERLSGSVAVLQEVDYKLRQDVRTNTTNILHVQALERGVNAIVLNTGILDHLSDNQFKLALSRECVKQLYVLMPIEQVFKTRVFRNYAQSVAANAYSLETL